MKKQLKLVALLAALLLVPLVCEAQTPVGKSGVTASGATIIGSTIPLINSGIAYHSATWNVTGTVNTCDFTIDSSANGVSWSTGGVITSTNCATNGNATIVNVVANYIRINISTFTGTGSVSVTWNGYTTNGGGGGGTPCTTTPSSLQYDASGSFGCVSGITSDGTNATVGSGTTFTIASGGTLTCAAGSTCPASGGGGSITTTGLTAYLVYYRTSGSYAAAEANAIGTTPALCVASSTTNCVTNGSVTNGSWTWTDGGVIYLSDASGGGLTQTAPTTSGHFVQIVGVATSSTSMYVMPSLDVSGL
jgi:hypothetical protein